MNSYTAVKVRETVLIVNLDLRKSRAIKNQNENENLLEGIGSACLCGS
jgi:hypothetical protein